LIGAACDWRGSGALLLSPAGTAPGHAVYSKTGLVPAGASIPMAQRCFPGVMHEG
jgi:hypothetical protein